MFLCKRLWGVAPAAKPKLKPIDREQGLLRTVIVDELVAEDHKVRAIWDLTGELDLTRFYSKISLHADVEAATGAALEEMQIQNYIA
jgi:hypothetical protein